MTQWNKKKKRGKNQCYQHGPHENRVPVLGPIWSGQSQKPLHHPQKK